MLLYCRDAAIGEDACVATTIMLYGCHYMGRYMCCYDYYVVWMLLRADIGAAMTILCRMDVTIWADICATMTTMSYGCCYGQI